MCVIVYLLYGVWVFMLYGEYVGGLNMKFVVVKLKGRRWVGYFVSVFWEDDNLSSEVSWLDGYCVLYDLDMFKYLVIYLVMVMVECVNFEIVLLRLGFYGRKYDVRVDKKGRVFGDYVVFYVVLKFEFDVVCVFEMYFSGCWCDDVVGNGIFVDFSCVGECGVVFFDVVEASVEEVRDVVVDDF